MKVNDEFRRIAKEIVDENKSDEEWSEVESDDMFQTESFIGGYDATEQAFCFSYYDEKKNEYWFQLTLEEMRAVANGTLSEIGIRTAG